MSTPLDEWITRLSEPNAAFGGLPTCPFAQGAKLIGMRLRSQGDLIIFLDKLVRVDPGVVIVVEVPPQCGVPSWARRNPEWIALHSRRSSPIVIAGFRTTQDFGDFILIQNRAELLARRDALKARGYFANWSEENLRAIGIRP